MKTNKKTCSSVVTVLLIWLIGLSQAWAEPATEHSGIAVFAKCSRQCAAEREQCRTALEKDCRPAGDDCYESCDVAYPACMAKCPRPGA